MAISAPFPDSEWLTQIMRGLPSAVYAAPLDSGLTAPRLLDAVLVEHIGMPAGDFLRDPNLWRSGFHSGDVARMESNAKTIRTNGASAVDYAWQTRDGRERIFLEHGIVIQARDDLPRHVLGFAVDVTELCAVGAGVGKGVRRLDSETRHELNNMMTVVLWNLQTLAQHAGSGRDSFNRVRSALSVALGGSALLRRTLAKDTQVKRPQAIDLGEFLPRLVTLLLAAVGSEASISLAVPGRMPPLTLDPVQLEQAVVDLAFYTLWHSARGGRLTIGVAESEVGDGVTLSFIGNRPQKPAPAHNGHADALARAHEFAREAGASLRVDCTGEKTELQLDLPRTSPASVARPH